MYLKVKKARLEPDKRGQKIVITMVGLYNNDDKRVKRVKLDDDIVQSILTSKLEIDAITNRNTSKQDHTANDQKLF